MTAVVRILTVQEKAMVCDLYTIGIPIYELRALFHTTVARVRDALVEGGIEIRDTTGLHRRKFIALSLDQGATVLELLKRQVPLGKIVRETGLNGRSVAIFARTTPWWARCERCGETLRSCAEWFWRLEKNGLCGKCASSEEDFKISVSADFREGYTSGWMAALSTLKRLAQGNGLWGTAWEKARRHWEKALVPWQGQGYEDTWPPELDS